MNNGNAGAANGGAVAQPLPQDLLVDDAIARVDGAANADQLQLQLQQPQQEQQEQQLPAQPVAPVITSIDAATSALLNATQPIGHPPTFTGDLLEGLRSRVIKLFETYYSLSEEQVAHEALDVILQSNLSTEEKLRKIQQV